MDREPVTIPGEISVEQALDEYFLRYRWPWFPVVDAAHRFLGLLNRDAADEVPEVSRAGSTGQRNRRRTTAASSSATTPRSTPCSRTRTSAASAP